MNQDDQFNSTGSNTNPILPANDSQDYYGSAQFQQPAPIQQQNPSFDFSQSITSLPAEANDLDLIEKEWVIHLKNIVTQTVGSPHLQQREISLAKADYLRKRYGKEVKPSEG